ncbi:MAG: hypothetical protein K0R39_855 [Symbiobacteriaceae bacterium]|nr:hypothetical protein [Symbiobacteriaceae bacterium]
MRQTIKEGLGLAEQLAVLPFTAARQAFVASEGGRGPWAEVVRETLDVGEGLARLPFKATTALLSGAGTGSPSLEERVAELERRMGMQPPPPADNPG